MDHPVREVPRTYEDRWRAALRSAVFVALGLIALLEVVQEALASRRRTKSRINAWWSRFERRQQREVHKAEVGFLARLATPR